MADTMVHEIAEGIAGCGVKCGVIGEIGCSYPLMDCEKKALQAAAMAQTRTGMSTDVEVYHRTCTNCSLAPRPHPGFFNLCTRKVGGPGIRSLVTNVLTM